MPMPRFAQSLALAALLLPAAAHAQDRGSVNPKPLPPLEHPDAP
jgi:penicillin-insensitive murein endopeptidase